MRSGARLADRIKSQLFGCHLARRFENVGRWLFRSYSFECRSGER